jgi:hypothetical protein
MLALSFDLRMWLKKDQKVVFLGIGTATDCPGVRGSSNREVA